MKKSLSLNAAMSAFKTLMNIIFPLITFPYASNVLQVENLGQSELCKLRLRVFSAVCRPWASPPMRCVRAPAM